MLENRLNAEHLPDDPGVYRIVCVPTGESYIGAAYSIFKRAHSHSTCLATGSGLSPRRLRAAYGQHGPQAFVVEVLELCAESQLAERESYWIGALSPLLNSHKRSNKQTHRRRGDGSIIDARLVSEALVYRVSRQVLPPEKYQERQRRIAEVAAIGLPTKQIAKLFRANPCSVRRAIHEFDVPRTRERKPFMGYTDANRFLIASVHGQNAIDDLDQALAALLHIPEVASEFAMLMTARKCLEEVTGQLRRRGQSRTPAVTEAAK